MTVLDREKLLHQIIRHCRSGKPPDKQSIRDVVVLAILARNATTIEGMAPTISTPDLVDGLAAALAYFCANMPDQEIANVCDRFASKFDPALHAIQDFAAKHGGTGIINPDFRSPGGLVGHA